MHILGLVLGLSLGLGGLCGSPVWAQLEVPPPQDLPVAVIPPAPEKPAAPPATVRPLTPARNTPKIQDRSPKQALRPAAARQKPGQIALQNARPFTLAKNAEPTRNKAGLGAGKTSRTNAPLAAKARKKKKT